MWQVIWLVLLASVGLSAWAADIRLTMRAEQEVRTIMNGETLIRTKPISRTHVGDVVTITLSYENMSNEEASNVNIDNPIPAGTRFVLGSGFGEGAHFFVSYDYGKTYDDDIQIRHESATNVRWTLDTVPAYGKGEVGFQLRVEEANARF
jgi:uncharacterized repeat protein (TIGR01451 family)